MRQKPAKEKAQKFSRNPDEGRVRKRNAVGGKRGGLDLYSSTRSPSNRKNGGDRRGWAQRRKAGKDKWEGGTLGSSEKKQATKKEK